MLAGGRLSAPAKQPPLCSCCRSPTHSRSHMLAQVRRRARTWQRIPAFFSRRCRFTQTAANAPATMQADGRHSRRTCNSYLAPTRSVSAIEQRTRRTRYSSASSSTFTRTNLPQSPSNHFSFSFPSLLLDSFQTDHNWASARGRQSFRQTVERAGNGRRECGCRKKAYMSFSRAFNASANDDYSDGFLEVPSSNTGGCPVTAKTPAGPEGRRHREGWGRPHDSAEACQRDARDCEKHYRPKRSGRA